jgi:hypothetical protein
MMSTYLPPVDSLLKLGEPEVFEPEEWQDYARLGLGPEHVQELVRLALDRSMDELDTADPARWAYIHAWRALGQMRAMQAIRPLMRLFSDLRDDEWMFDELPDVYALIGPPAISPLAEYMEDPAQPAAAREMSVECLLRIATKHPEWQGECVEVMTRQLERFAENGPDLNAFLVSALIDLGAKEAAPLIEQAYQAERVSEEICGDWEDVQVGMGLKQAREGPPKTYLHLPLPAGDLRASGAGSSTYARKSEDAKAKAKRKQADKSRKQNRKKKKGKRK